MWTFESWEGKLIYVSILWDKLLSTNLFSAIQVMVLLYIKLHLILSFDKLYVFAFIFFFWMSCICQDCLTENYCFIFCYQKQQRRKSSSGATEHYEVVALTFPTQVAMEIWFVSNLRKLKRESGLYFDRHIWKEYFCTSGWYWRK